MMGGRILKPTLRTMLALLGTVVILASIKIAVTPLPNNMKTPSGRTRNEALYLTMRDGVKIAVDIWLPADLATGDTLPTLLRSTRYGRSFQPYPITQALIRLGVLPKQMVLDEETAFFNEAGYAVVLVDARGSGASFGTRPVEWSADEIADLGEVADWIVAQPWSNGKIGSWGVSYDGNTAELSTVPNHPAIKAVAPQYSDFDPMFNIAQPGGVFNRRFIESWYELNSALDSNDMCRFIQNSNVSAPCFLVKPLIGQGIKPVHADENGRLLAAAVAEHDSLDLFTAVQAAPYRDDLFGNSGLSFAAFSPYGLRQHIENSAVPMFVWVSWLDAGTVDGALSRYLTLSNSQSVIIGPWSHGGGAHADPFLPPETPPDPLVEKQRQMLVDFFDLYLKDEAATEPQANITYYTLGEGVWKTTDSWPPDGVIAQRYYFGGDSLLTPHAPTEEAGIDEYTVDFATSTGAHTRWHTQLGGGDVVYPDRAEEDEKLLTYTSLPLLADVEITGIPVVTLYVSSTETDGAFHVYLEDVAPDGRVTYLTEGILRAIHHPISEAEPPYVPLGPYHSFNQYDARPLTPGETTVISFSLYATSVLIRQGHRIRLAIAGHDASMFARYPTTGTPLISIARSAIYPSHVDLPMIERP